MELDSDSLFCGRTALCGCDDNCRYHVQAPGIVEYRNSALYFLVISALDDQTIMESFRRSGQDKAFLDYCHAGFVAAGFAGIAFFIPTPHYVQLTLAFFWLMAFSSATHDIAADGFYMLGLNNKEQSFFVGIRNTCYRFANIFGQGILVMLAGWLETSGMAMFQWPGVSLSI